MRRDLHDMERGMALGIPGQGECPVASARGCWAVIYCFQPSMIKTADSAAAMRFKSTGPAENEK